MLGLNDILIKQYSQNFGSHLQSPGSCYLFDFESYTLYTFQVPFVVGLTDSFSQLRKDQLLLKEFTNVPVDTNNFPIYISLFDKIKTHQIKWSAIDFIIDHSLVPLVKDLCQRFASQLPVDLDNLDASETKIDPLILVSAHRCQKLVQLCQFYQSFHELVSQIDDGLPIVNSIHQNPPDIETQAESLGWSARNYARCVSIFSFKEVVTPGEETILNPDFLTLAELVDFFIPERSDQSNQNPSKQAKSKPTKSRTFRLEQLHRIGNFILFPGLVTENLEVCASHIETASTIAPQELLYCLFASWLHTDFASDWKHWPRFNRYVTLIVTMLRQKYPSGESQWLKILKIICSLIAQSTLIPSALIASMILLTLYSQFDLGEEAALQMTNENPDDDTQGAFKPEEWESLSIVKEKLNLLINQLESTFFLSLTLHSNVNHDPGQISLAFLQDSTPGIISESIAKWAISYPLDPSTILSLENVDFEDDDDHQSGSANQMIAIGVDVSSQEEAHKLDSEVIKQLLAKVHDQFPHSMDSDIILANCAWECLILWDKDPTMGATRELLTQCLKYIEPLSSAVLKHNMACLIWKMSIRKRMETLTGLIEKMGKTPKDRILKRDIGIGEGSLEDFLKFVVDLIDLIIDSLGPAESDAMPIFRLDDWWKHRNWSNSQFPLVFIVIQQKPADPDLLLQLYDMSLVVTLIVNFQIKHFKPLSLFPFDVQKAFFGELSFPLANSQADSLLTQNREKFLLSAAGAVAYSVPPSTSLIEEEIQLYSIANQWMGKIVRLSKHWDIHPDSARQRYICDLYSNCCDALAEEVVNMVTDREALAVVLLPVAGQRILYLIKPEKDKFIASTPPYVISWLENLIVRQDINLNFNVATTTKMLEYILSFLPNENNKIKIAKNLLSIASRLG